MSWARCLPILLVVLIPFSGRADDLKDIVDRDSLVVQKLVGDVNYALSQAKAWEKADPARAKEILEKALSLINNSRELPEDQRVSWRRRVTTRIQDINQLVRVREIAQDDTARRDAAKKRETQEVIGSGTAATAQKYLASSSAQIAAAQRLREQRSQNTTGILNQLEASATPIAGVVEFPKYWAALTENRAKIAGNRLSEKEITLLKALNSVISVDFQNRSFREVIDYLMEKTGQAIIIDENSLKETNTDPSDTLTFQVKKVTVRTVLRKILADKGLAYVLKEGTIQVVSNAKAREMMVVRSYPVDDLVGRGNPQFYGPYISRQIMISNVNTLIQNVQNAVDPALWNVNGGPGSVTFFEPGMALVIRAPAEMHYMLGGGGLFR